MVVVLLAQAGGFSTSLRILILENHELVDFDWEEDAESKARHRQASPGAERTHLWTM